MLEDEGGIEEPKLIEKENKMGQAEVALLVFPVMFRGCRRNGLQLALSEASWRGWQVQDLD